MLDIYNKLPVWDHDKNPTGAIRTVEMENGNIQILMHNVY